MSASAATSIMAQAIKASRGSPQRIGRRDASRDEGAPPILIVPGLDNSGPDHWQSHWERTLPKASRIEQADWARPKLEAWSAKLIETVQRQPEAVLVAHSLGCALVAHVAAEVSGYIAGALLVAPADVDRPDTAGERLTSFAPMPLWPLPFPSIVAASRNDSFVQFERAQAFAEGWGSTFVDLGRAGHVNVQSGHNQWMAGQELLAWLIDRLSTDVSTVGGERGHRDSLAVARR